MTDRTPISLFLAMMALHAIVVHITPIQVHFIFIFYAWIRVSVFGDLHAPLHFELGANGFVVVHACAGKLYDVACMCC